MLKTAYARFEQAWTVIGEVVGRRAQEHLEARHPTLNTAQKQTFGGMISLGGVRGLSRSGEESRKRKLVRAILLAVVMQRQPQPGELQRMRVHLLGQPPARLEADLRNRFPFSFLRGALANRQFWTPGNFSDPANHQPGRFRYIAHSVTGARLPVAKRGALTQDSDSADFDEILRRMGPAYTEIERKKVAKDMFQDHLKILPFKRLLDDPTRLRQEIVSCSVIDQDHCASYFPWGFVIQAAGENIVSANPRDQGVKNRSQQLVGELQRVNDQYGIQTPDTLLATTRRGGETGYNEVVVAGAVPTGQCITVTGIFVKSTADGRHLYIRKDGDKPGQPYVSEELVELIEQSARRWSLPIVKIPDPESQDSDVPWPFGRRRRVRRGRFSDVVSLRDTFVDKAD